MINQTNPHAGYLALKDEIDEAVMRALDSGRYILGGEVSSFEREFSGYVGVEQTVGVASGTDAIELALRASGISPGDRVATVSHTAVATAAAISRLDAIPVFVDIDPLSFTMDPKCLAAVLDSALGQEIKAVVVVHLYGQMADMSAIMEIAGKSGLTVIEDCAQAHGAMQNGVMAGSTGNFGCFSFYPTKNLGAIGDGGCVVTNSGEAGDRLRMLREYGWNKSRISEMIGINSRLDELQAAILRVKLRHLNEANAARRRIAGIYDLRLEGSCAEIPLSRNGNTHVYHQYVIRSGKRDNLRDRLKSLGIDTGIHYAVPVHLHPAYAGERHVPIYLEHTEKAVSSILSLPMFPELSDDQAVMVAESIVKMLRD